MRMAAAEGSHTSYPQVYVDLAGWHLYTRDMNATPTMKMSQALATQLGPKVRKTCASFFFLLSASQTFKRRQAKRL